MTFRVMGFNMSHDSSACLVEDGEIKAALALERTTRVKRGTVPVHEYAAAMADLTEELLTNLGLNSPDIDLWIATSTESRDAADEACLSRALGLVAPRERCVHLPHPGHHLAHASAAFHSSGFDEAAALVIDAYGSLIGATRERESGFHLRHGQIPQCVLRTTRKSERAAGYRRDGEIWLPAKLSGVGEMYRVITLALGFHEAGTIYDDAGKTMGLASYGSRLTGDNLFVELLPGGELSFDRLPEALVELGVAVRDGDELRLVPRRPREAATKFHYDLAAQVQAEFEDACLHLTREILARTGSTSLVAAGGCMLNSSLNTRLLREAGIDRLFVFPAATDDGNSAGAALYAYHYLSGRQAAPSPALEHVFLGPSRTAGRDLMPLADRWGLRARRHASSAQITVAAAQSVARGEIVGWFQNRAEFGPRSLGARSILCHPGIPGMKDRLNARVKFREAFRPFAASVLAEQAHKWFDMPTEQSPFMLLVCPVLPNRIEQVSEITHVDGTCRLQTVGEATPGPFRAVLEAFEQETGLPLLLNTSFNLRGMPIVERPAEALDCLYGSRLDRLFMGDLEIEPPDLNELCPRRIETETGWSASRQTTDVSAAIRSGLPDPSLRILDMADGATPMHAVAKALGTDVDKAVDLALDMRRLRLLRWVGVPEAVPPAYPLAQYLPDASAM
jgi:carbamoyltransferase